MVPQENRPTMLDVWIELAQLLARRSTCSRRHVGAVVVSSNMKSIYGYGYNGNYAGGPNGCDRPEASGNCGCIHAEDNAFTNSIGKDKNMVMISLVVPCPTCAKRIVNEGGIKTVYYTTDYHTNEGIVILENSGIKVIKYEQGIQHNPA
jgi:dCMP deaminase